MLLPSLPGYEKRAGAGIGSPRATAGFRFPAGGGSFRRTMTTVALSTESYSDGDPTVEQALNSVRYRQCTNPGPGAYNCGPGPSSGPMWTMGRKTWVERKIPGAKLSLEKTWFCTGDPWRQKVDALYRDEQWPEPTTYRLRSLGQPDPTRPRQPEFPFTARDGFDPERRRRLEAPPPGAYETGGGGGGGGSCSIGRRNETRLWPPLSTAPGPGRYENARTTSMFELARDRRFTMKGPKDRIDYSRTRLGPFFAF